LLSGASREQRPFPLAALVDDCKGREQFFVSYRQKSTNTLANSPARSHGKNNLAPSSSMTPRTPRQQVERDTNVLQDISPDRRQQTITHLALVFAIARQMVHEETFLVHQAPYQQGHQREHDQHAPG
jgi:hypothetical protein